MSLGNVLFWSAVLLGGMALLYGLHRLALRLEDRGHLYYLRKKPSGSAAGSFVAFQRIVEPQAQHVIELRDHVSHDEDEASGRGRRTDGAGEGPVHPESET